MVVITQNIDNLHERAGSTQVLHLHGEITKARSTADEHLTYDIGYKPILWGQRCKKNSQIRPHIVWFGEEIFHYNQAQKEFGAAQKILVVGTSLKVYPAAGLIQKGRSHVEKVLLSLVIESAPPGFSCQEGPATVTVPSLGKKWQE